jgi:hypothetical protein
MVLIQGTFIQQQLLYDVSDPVHPRLLCTISNTSAHLFTGDTFEWLKPISANETDVVLHSLSTGHDSLAGTFPFRVTSGSWLPDRSVMAYTLPVPPDDANFPNGGVAVYLYAHQQTGPLFSYPIPATDCICRFGLPQEVLAVSPDGQFVVAGRPIGKAPQPLAVYRVSDRSFVAKLDPTVIFAFWDRTGHRLFLNRSNYAVTPPVSQAWTPEAGVSNVPGAGPWSFLPGLSPDGGMVAYTAYLNDQPPAPQPRVFLYEMKAGKTRMVVDKLRTQILFVKNGWVWYLEEVQCDPQVCGAPWGTQPTGKIFAMQLSAGTETEVNFAAGENPVVVQDGHANWTSFGPGEFWPAT